jgi:tRNA-dihydrouridine synthase C
MTWEEITELLVHFFDANGALYERKFAINPVKQWLVYLQYAYPQAAALFAQIKRIRDPDPMRAALIGANQSVAA